MASEPPTSWVGTSEALRRTRVTRRLVVGFVKQRGPSNPALTVDSCSLVGGVRLHMTARPVISREIPPCTGSRDLRYLNQPTRFGEPVHRRRLIERGRCPTGLEEVVVAVRYSANWVASASGTRQLKVSHSEASSPRTCGRTQVSCSRRTMPILAASTTAWLLGSQWSGR